MLIRRHSQSGSFLYPSHTAYEAEIPIPHSILFLVIFLEKTIIVDQNSSDFYRQTEFHENHTLNSPSLFHYIGSPLLTSIFKSGCLFYIRRSFCVISPIKWQIILEVSHRSEGLPVYYNLIKYKFVRTTV